MISSIIVYVGNFKFANYYFMKVQQTPQPSPYGPVMYGAGVPYGNQPPLMPYQQNPKWGVGPMNSLPNNRVPPMQRDKLGLKKVRLMLLYITFIMEIFKFLC